MTDDSEKVVLKKVLYIKYLVQCQEKKVKALLNNSNKVNVMSLNYAQKLGLNIWKICIRS